MRILAIRGQNLASLARSFELDLANGPLRHAGLFAITGPVGAGKSTLLDALCLALFDRTPRLSNRGGVPVGDDASERGDWLRSNDPRTLLRRDAAEGWAEVDFTGRDGGRYRARWSVRRARRRVDGRVQDQVLSLVDLDRGHVVAGGRKTEVLAAIEQRLGLDFGQFCRSVLLAQGEFAAFLRASADDRARLLENLTGADVYRRLSRAAHERRRAQQKRVETMQAQFAAQPLLEPAARTALEREREALAGEHAICMTAVDIAQRYVNWYAAAAQRQQEEAEATVALQAAVERDAAAADRRARILRLQAATALLPQWRLVQQRRQEAMVAAAAADAMARGLAEAAAGLDAARAALQPLLRAAFGDVAVAPAVVRDFVRHEPLLQRRLDAAARLAACAQQQPGLRAAWQQAKAELPAAQESVRQAEAKQRAAVEGVRAAERANDTPELAQRIQRRHVCSARRGELDRLARHLEAAVAATAAARAAGDRVVALAAERDRLAAAFPALVAARTVAEGRLQAARAAAEHARSVAGLAALRAQLVAGEPCPLCGAHEHPAAGAPAHDVAAATAAAVVAQGAFDTAVRTVAESEVQQRHVADTLARAADEAGAAQQAAERAGAAWRGAVRDERLAGDAAWDRARAQLAQWSAACADEEAALAALEQRAHELAVGLANAVTGAAVANDQLHAARTAERAAERAVANAAETIQRAVTEAEALQAAVAEQDLSLAAAFAGVDDWQERLGRGGVAWFERVRRAHSADARCGAAEVAVAEARRVHEAALANARRAAADAEAAGAGLAQAIDESGCREQHVVEAAQVAPGDLARETRDLAAIAQDIVHRRAVLQERVEQRKKHERQGRPSLGEHEAQGALELANRRRDETARAQVEVGGRLAADDSVRRQRDEIAPRLEAAERELATWQALDDLIGSSDGDAFVVFAQGLTLDLLLFEANHRLAELARRYRLERNPGGEMDFVVVDLDLGGSRRGLQTLSGGETFLVSLALALALATLAAPRSRVETLFLDEGFGTLDAHSLETALGALDSLQASGCQVGVISHVEGFAERIGAAVEVSPAGGGRSRVLLRVR